MTAHAVRDGYAFSPDAAIRMWARNATVARRTILVTLVPRFLEAIAYLAGIDQSLKHGHTGMASDFEAALERL